MLLITKEDDLFQILFSVNYMLRVEKKNHAKQKCNRPLATEIYEWGQQCPPYTNNFLKSAYNSLCRKGMK